MCATAEKLFRSENSNATITLLRHVVKLVVATLLPNTGDHRTINVCDQSTIRVNDDEAPVLLLMRTDDWKSKRKLISEHKRAL